MKSSKREPLYLVLSILTLIVGVGIDQVYGNRHTISSPVAIESKTTETETTETTKVEQTAQEKALTEALDAVANFEKKPNNQDLPKVQELVTNLQDETKKTELQARLDLLATELANQTAAEQAVVNAEGYQVQYNVDVAQNAINLITNTQQKSALQSRLDVVNAAIQAQAQTVYYVETTVEATLPVAQ